MWALSVLHSSRASRAASLQLRFGGEVLLRLDQALGSQPEAPTSLIPPEVPRAELRFQSRLPISTT
jgi:hypothetical protein